MDLSAIADEQANKFPWRKLLEEEKSEFSQMIAAAPKIFTRRLKSLITMANELKIAGE
jgi:hypothetical protein